MKNRRFLANNYLFIIINRRRIIILITVPTIALFEPQQFFNTTIFTLITTDLLPQIKSFDIEQFSNTLIGTFFPPQNRSYNRRYFTTLTSDFNVDISFASRHNRPSILHSTGNLPLYKRSSFVPLVSLPLDWTKQISE